MKTGKVGASENDREEQDTIGPEKKVLGAVVIDDKDVVTNLRAVMMMIAAAAASRRLRHPLHPPPLHHLHLETRKSPNWRQQRLRYPMLQPMI